MTTSVIRAGGTGVAGVQTTGGDDGALALKVGPLSTTVEALSITSAGAATLASTLAVTGGVTGVTAINSGQIGGRRNIIHNGDFKIAQRGASSTGLGAASGYFTVDRFYMQSAATAGRYTMAQVADGPAGFANCLKLTTTTADTSIAAGEYLLLSSNIEGQDLQHLKKGTASAEQVTVSFWVKGNAAALYVCELQDLDTAGGRVNTQSFAVTTSWNRIELTFAGDTTGALNDDNGASLGLNFWLHVGSTYGGGTFAGDNTWAGITQANRAAVDGFTSIFDATSRTFFITGVQMEIGATATEFESRTYGEELALCQRYLPAFTRVAGGAAAGQFPGIGNGQTTTAGFIVVNFPVPARKSATGVTVSDVAHFQTGSAGVTSDIVLSAIAFNQSSSTAALINITQGSATSITNFVISLRTNTTDAIMYFTGCEL